MGRPLKLAGREAGIQALPSQRAMVNLGVRRCDESLEQRMRLMRFALELRVKL